MNLFKYFSFFYRLTKGRLPVLFAINLVAIFSQMAAAGALLTVIQFGNKEQNRITKITYYFIDMLNMGSDNYKIAFLLAFVTLGFFLSSIALMYSMIYTARLQSNIYVDLQPETVRKLIDSDYEYFQTQNVGNMTNVIVQQIRVVAQSFKLYSDIVLSTLFALLYIFIPLMLNPILCIIMLVVGLPFIYFIKISNKKSQEISIANVQEVSRLNAVIIQMVANLKYLKSTRTYEDVLPKLAESTHKIALLVRKIAFWSGLSSYGITPFAVGLIAILIYWQIAVMKIPILDALTTLAILYGVSQKLIAIPSSYQKFLVSAGAIIIFEDFIKELNENIEKEAGTAGKMPDFAGNISFEDISYKYKSGKEEVLKNISFEIKKNSSVAFVGGSGAGKSTIVNLVTGLLKPTMGRITLAGDDYTSLNIKELRRHIGYVTQEPVIFNDSVKNNISMWDRSSKAAGTANFAKLAHADIFIKEMPASYETLLGDNGINISGGQRQRISIARELYRETPILILDEATSALDSETEQIIHQSIDEFKGRKTLLIIAHRLSTIRNCDIIYVLEKGNIIESGSYEELYRNGGKFREMVDRQTLNTE